MNAHGGGIYRLGHTVTDFSSNINPLGVPPSFRRALLQEANAFTRYPDLCYQEMKEQIGAYLKVDTGRLVLGNGAVDILYQLAKLLPCRRAVIAAPTFSEYRRAFSLAGKPAEERVVFRTDTGKTDIGGLMEVEAGTAVVLCNPNNPTGTLLQKDALFALLAALEKKQCYLIIDEAFIEFCEDAEASSVLEFLEGHPALFVVRAATKYFGMPGIRLGYGLTSDKALCAAFWETAEPWKINTAAVLAASVVFRDQEYLRRTREWILCEREHVYQLYQTIPKLVRIYPSSANFFLFEIAKEGATVDMLYERLLAAGFLIRKAEGFTGLSDRHFRAAVKRREDNLRFFLAVKECLEDSI